MSALRVFIVDDSVVVRRVVAKVIEGEPGLEVAGSARNGKVALSKIPGADADVVVLDVEMPEMNGLETLRVLRNKHPALSVVMFSSLTKRGAETTLDALEQGASDYVAKPGTTQGLAETQALIREELVPKVRALGSSPREATREATREAPARRRPKSGGEAAGALGADGIDVVAIGSSTGGPNALRELLPALPADFPVPVVVVQHMPPVFTKSLADRLDKKSPLEIREGSDGDVLAPGGVWIAPGDAHMELERAGTTVQLRMHQGPLENSCRPAVDVLFRSVPVVYGARALGVVLTGMGKDGAHGAQHIADAGGRIIAQDEDSSVVWGMPGAVTQAGLAEEVFPLGELAGELQYRANHRRTQKVFS